MLPSVCPFEMSPLIVSHVFNHSLSVGKFPIYSIHLLLALQLELPPLPCCLVLQFPSLILPPLTLCCLSLLLLSGNLGLIWDMGEFGNSSLLFGQDGGGGVHSEDLCWESWGLVGDDFHSSHPNLGSGLSVGGGHLRSVEKKELVGLEYK